MIKAFDPSNLKELRRDIDAAFAAIRQKHGVTLSLGNISYAPDKATTRLTMIAVGDASVATDPRAAALAKAQIEFNRYASSFGLKPEQFGATFKHGRDTYKLAGVKPRSSRYPILGTNVANGTTYKLPESAIASLQSKEHRDLFGINPPTATATGMCSNDNAYDEKFNPIGKCNRAATTTRKDGFGRDARMQPFCDKCASLIDESRAEMAAEARMS
jgi:hypothetical protein